MLWTSVIRNIEERSPKWLKKLVPVSAVVLAFLGFFMISALVLDVWKPVPISP